MISNFDHIILYFISFAFLYNWGVHNYQKKGISYWISASIPLLIISFIIGSRTWGADYNLYRFEFVHAFNQRLLWEQQPLFVYFNRLLNWIGCSYVVGFTVYTLIYFIAAFILYKSFGKYSKYMYAFLLCSYLGFGTSIIRQAFANSFIILCIVAFEKRRLELFVISLVIAFSMHTASISLLAIYLILKLMVRQMLPLQVTVPLYIGIAFLFNPEWMSGFETFFSYLDFGDSKFQFYLNDTDRWFSKDSLQLENEQGLIAKILNVGYVVSLFYLGYLAIKKSEDKRLITFYNLVVVGYIGLRFFLYLELLKRIFIPCTSFFPIILGFSIYILWNKEISLTRTEKKIRNITLSLSIIYLFLFWGRFIFLNEESNFFWS